MTTARSSRNAPGVLRRFLEVEASGGIVLGAATVCALLWANLAPGSYDSLWGATAGFEGRGLDLELDLRHWVNEGLMTLFFFVVGLEIKRELVHGELKVPRVAALPVMAALGGMVVPALIYLALSSGGLGARGWGVPVATDIAFVVGVLAVLGSRIPRGLRTFLLTLAIADDIAAIAVIALFYAGEIDLIWMAGAVVLTGSVLPLRRAGVESIGPYIAVGALLWLATLQAGIHATLAGVVLGLLAPADDEPGEKAPAERLQKSLHPWSSFAIVPLFALANAGVRLDLGSFGEALGSPTARAIMVGLVVGKTVGITTFSWLAIRLRIGSLPSGVSWHHLIGGAALGGIGFTISMLIADIAFAGVMESRAKVGILVGSAAAALLGGAILRSAARSTA